MTVQAKAIIDAFYGSAPKVSFWNGCSPGGRQGITEAQRYPGRLRRASSPARRRRRHAPARGCAVAVSQPCQQQPDSYIPPAKMPVIHDAVLDACDALDGVKDGVHREPAARAISIRKARVQGRGRSGLPDPAQVETAKALYAPVKNPKTGKVITAPLEPGSELGWATLGGAEPLGLPRCPV